MPHSEQQFLIITALGTDHPGIVNTIIQLVSKCGCNIEDSRLAIFGQEFTFIMMLSGSRQSISLIEATLPKKGAELELLFIMKRTTLGICKEYSSIVTAKVIVNDAPGIVEQFTCLFITHNFNLAELISKIHPATDKYDEQLEIQITAQNPIDDNELIIKNRFKQLCTKLNAQGTISIISKSQ